MPNDLEKRIAELERIVNGLKSAAQTDPDIAVGLSEALSVALSDQSTKTSTSENQAVDEAGAATYNVLKPPDKFKQDSDGDYIPAWTA